MGGWPRSDNKANSVQLLLQLPTGTELSGYQAFKLCDKWTLFTRLKVLTYSRD